MVAPTDRVSAEVVRVKPQSHRTGVIVQEEVCTKNAQRRTCEDRTKTTPAGQKLRTLTRQHLDLRCLVEIREKTQSLLFTTLIYGTGYRSPSCGPSDSALLLHPESPHAPF